MRVLLVAPPQSAAYGQRMNPVYPPMGLLSLAAVLEQEGHVVRVLDADAEGVTVHAAVRWAFRWHADLIGLTATTPTFSEACRWAARFRSSLNCPVVVGGPHASALPEETMATECFDAVVCGEGEGTIGQLIVQLTACRDRNSMSVCQPPDGVRDPEVLLDEEALCQLPLPAWHLVRRPDRYRPPDALHIPVGTVMFSRGCPGGCRFCQSTTLFGAKVRYLSPSRAVQHAWHVHRITGAREIHIIDDCFTANRNRALAIIEALIEHGPPATYTFGNGLRADMLDDDLLRAMAVLPVRSFGLGIETGDARVAGELGKHTDLARIADVVDRAQKWGISVWGFFMLGLPGETHESLGRTVRYARDLHLDVAKFEIFKPYPGTPLFDELREHGSIRSRRWSDWGIHTPPVHGARELSGRAVWRARRRAILAFYVHPRAVLSTMGASRTWTRMLLNLRAATFLIRTLARMQ